MKHSFLITPEMEGIRIDLSLSKDCPDYSRSYLQKLIKEGFVEVNQKPVKSNYKVLAGDTIELEIPDLVVPQIRAEHMELDILYEDSDLILINKPKGMVVHPAAGHFEGTLVNGLMAHCCDDLSGINGVMRPGIVHRIDMDTTGVLIVCKNDFSHQHIAAQLKEHSITRVYFAVVHGIIKEEEGTVDAPIGRHPTDRKKMSVNYKHGREAVTHYRVLERFRQFTYIECRLETGRTHQIRVHMASIHHPLLGDRVYGPAKSPFPSLEGQTLHAGILGIIHPRSGQYMEIQAPLPQYFEQLLKKLETT